MWSKHTKQGWWFQNINYFVLEGQRWWIICFQCEGGPWMVCQYREVKERVHFDAATLTCWRWIHSSKVDIWLFFFTSMGKKSYLWVNSAIWKMLAIFIEIWPWCCPTFVQEMQQQGRILLFTQWDGSLQYCYGLQERVSCDWSSQRNCENALSSTGLSWTHPFICEGICKRRWSL